MFNNESLGIRRFFNFFDSTEGPSKMTFPESKDYCEKQGLMLPKPSDDVENAQFAEIGPTWINILVNGFFKGLTKNF